MPASAAPFASSRASTSAACRSRQTRSCCRQSTEFLPAPLDRSCPARARPGVQHRNRTRRSAAGGVLFVKRQTVIDRGVELAEAGERVKFGEPLTRVIEDLLLDWLGNAAFDAGFDQIMRTTDAGAEFFRQIADIVAPQAAGASALAYQQQFAQATVSRSAHLSAIASGPSGSPTPSLTIARAAGVHTPDDEAGAKLDRFRCGVGADGRPSTSAFDIVGAVGPRPLSHSARRARQRACTISASSSPGRRPGSSSSSSFPALRSNRRRRAGCSRPHGQRPTDAVGRSRTGTARSTDVRARRPSRSTPAAAAHRRSSARVVDMDTAGGVERPGELRAARRRPVRPAGLQTSAELKSNYQIGSNAVIGAELQHSGRLVYLVPCRSRWAG